MLLNAYSPIYFVFIATIAFSTSYILDRLFGAPAVKHRESALDGLRGFLVIGVFVCHATHWISRKGGGAWAAPDGLLSALGPTCVVLFFMTTAFLYYGKLLRDRGREVDWLHIAVSRVLRLTPLCIVMAVCAFGVALFTKGFVIVDDVPALAKTFLLWASVGLGGSPDINGLKSSWLLNAGVVWTLTYECLFYVALPFFGIVALVKSNTTVLLISTVLLILVFQVVHLSEWHTMMAFFGGILAAYAVQKAWMVKICKGPIAALVFIACVGNVILSHRNVSGSVSLVLLTIAFVIVVCDNDIFGLLSLRGVQSFGDVGYSAYLLHGLLLYLAFHSESIDGFDGSLTPVKHWSIVAGLSILLVLICRLTFKYVEMPAMNAAPLVHARISKFIDRLKGVAAADF